MGCRTTDALAAAELRRQRGAPCISSCRSCSLPGSGAGWSPERPTPAQTFLIIFLRASGGGGFLSISGCDAAMWILTCSISSFSDSVTNFPGHFAPLSAHVIENAMASSKSAASRCSCWPVKTGAGRYQLPAAASRASTAAKEPPRPRSRLCRLGSEDPGALPSKAGSRGGPNGVPVTPRISRWRPPVLCAPPSRARAPPLPAPTPATHRRPPRPIGRTRPRQAPGPSQR
jgi:hypothetical protein